MIGLEFELSHNIIVKSKKEAKKNSHFVSQSLLQIIYAQLHIW